MGRNDRALAERDGAVSVVARPRCGRCCEQLFPTWDGPAAAGQWHHWTPPAEIPAAVRFGQGEVQLAQIEGGLPEDPRLLPAADRLHAALACSPSRSIRCCC